MKRILPLFLTILTVLNSCKEKDKSVDPSKRVRPVGLKVAVSDGNYKLTWEGFRIICITSPCPDVADVEAEEYEIQIASEELGPFQTYKTVDAGTTSINIPMAGRGEQLVARVVSKAKGAPPVNSIPVMVTTGLLSQSAYYPGFGTLAATGGGDVTTDGKRATYIVTEDAGNGQYAFLLYWAELQNEQIISSKLITREVGPSKFSPDGQQIAYFSGTGNGLIIYDIATGNTRTLPVADVGTVQGFDWSPDGKWLAYTTVSDAQSRLWKIATSGGAATPLTPVLTISEFNYIRPANIDWSPDGKSIAVARIRQDTGDPQSRTVISLYSPDGNGELKYYETQPSWIDTTPAFSPDGKQLAFLSTRTEPSAFTYSLWVRDLTTGKSRRIELLPGLIPSNDYAPHWQGNERLVFMGTQQGKAGYFSVFL